MALTHARRGLFILPSVRPFFIRVSHVERSNYKLHSYVRILRDSRYTAGFY